MKLSRRYWFYLTSLLFAFLSPIFAYAHEQYVLTHGEITSDIAYHGPSVWSALNNPGNLAIALKVGIGSLLAFIIYFFWERSKLEQRFERFMSHFESFGHVVLRVALGVSLIMSAYYSVFLGPEIPLSTIPIGLALKSVLYILGIMIAIGLWSEIAALISLIILLLATIVYKDYMLSYINYLGEFLALILYGSRTFSFDRLLLGIKNLSYKAKEYEIAIIRVTYGISIMYPAIVYKLIHPEVIVDIVHKYNLTQFHWLFPQDPLLISLGTGLAQVVVGICVIIGFETRLSTFITFVLMTLSVIFFKEAVWPHYILLALALYLIINNGGEWSVDHYIQKHKAKKKLRAKNA